MGKHKISVNLSTAGIAQLQRELDLYKNSVIYKTRLLAERLSERGVEIARVRVSDYDAIFTGELIQSLHSEYHGSIPCGAVFLVITDCEHAAFVEFGTGSYGNDVPYPYPLPNGVSWVYGSGKTVKINSKGRYYWFYPGRDGQWHYTEGMESRPFMYETSLQLVAIVESVAREVFR